MMDNNQVFIPTRDDFKDLLAETVEQILERRIPEIIRRANRKEFLTTNEFEELTGASHRLQKYYRQTKKLPYSQEGRKIIYRTSDVEKFIRDREIRGRDLITQGGAND